MGMAVYIDGSSRILQPGGGWRWTIPAKSGLCIPGGGAGVAHVREGESCTSKRR